MICAIGDMWYVISVICVFRYAGVHVPARCPPHLLHSRRRVDSSTLSVFRTGLHPLACGEPLEHKAMCVRAQRKTLQNQWTSEYVVIHNTIAPNNPYWNPFIIITSLEGKKCDNKNKCNHIENISCMYIYAGADVLLSILLLHISIWHFRYDNQARLEPPA